MARILVVDDEKLIVKGIRFSLEQDNMEVDCAYDGAVSYTHLLYTTDSNVSREHFYGNSRISLLEESGGDDCYVPPSVPEYQLVPDSDEVFSYLKNVYRLRQGKER